MLAADNGHKEVVDELLREGANVIKNDRVSELLTCW